ncbi:hypothetical protein ALC53_02012 [Atta colombica]|uniref:Uncharacterized protein n=1 Tax=Atta colombica TaxID=520822 RepID=A0A195BRQ8_9HYME|nr:hypothetical protein ALC53_02012 [Atta colombica]
MPGGPTVGVARKWSQSEVEVFLQAHKTKMNEADAVRSAGNYGIRCCLYKTSRPSKRTAQERRENIRSRSPGTVTQDMAKGSVGKRNKRMRDYKGLQSMVKIHNATTRVALPRGPRSAPYFQSVSQRLPRKRSWLGSVIASRASRETRYSEEGYRVQIVVRMRWHESQDHSPKTNPVYNMKPERFCRSLIKCDALPRARVLPHEFQACPERTFLLEQVIFKRIKYCTAESVRYELMSTARWSRRFSFFLLLIIECVSQRFCMKNKGENARVKKDARPTRQIAPLSFSLSLYHSSRLSIPVQRAEV